MADHFSFIRASLTMEQQMNDAVCWKEVATISDLMSSGYSVNSRLQNQAGLHGDTALHLAAKLGHADILAMLLQHGANPMVKNDFNFTPINLAARHNKQACLEMLLSHAKNIPSILNSMWMQFGGSVILWREATDGVIAVLICATPNLRSARSNIQNNLCYLLVTRSMFLSLRLLVQSGYMLPRDQLDRLERADQSENKVYLDWLKQFKTKPHSLQHYCRVIIRQAFESRANVFYGSKCLPIPTSLQDYICMKAELHAKDTDMEVENFDDGKN